MKHASSLALAAVACAPVYRPPAPFVPLLERPGDLAVSGQVGTGGAQADVAYAPRQSLEVRGGVQVGGLLGEGHYALGTVGVGAWGAQGGGRYALHLDLGGGSSRGVTILGPPDTPDAGPDEVVFENGGMVGTAAFRGELAYEGGFGAVGAQAGLVGVLLDASEPGRDGAGAAIEACGFARAGSRAVQLQGHAGASLPVLTLDPNLGVPFPLLLGLGVVVNLPAPPPPAE